MVSELVASIKQRCLEALDDDFNAPVAVSALFEFSRSVNALLAETPPPTSGDLALIDALYQEIGGQVLGIVPAQAAGSRLSAEREAGLIRLLIELRAEARQRKDFAAADKIRDQAKALGVVLEDGKEGTSWKIE
jgi:cysteinyl-tRNA synthetase